MLVHAPISTCLSGTPGFNQAHPAAPGLWADRQLPLFHHKSQTSSLPPHTPSLTDPPAMPDSLSPSQIPPGDPHVLWQLLPAWAAPWACCPTHLCPIMAVGGLDCAVFLPGSLKPAFHYLEICKN